MCRHCQSYGYAGLGGFGGMGGFGFDMFDECANLFFVLAYAYEMLSYYSGIGRAGFNTISNRAMKAEDKVSTSLRCKVEANVEHRL